MKYRNILFIVITTSAFILMACNAKPKVIEQVNATPTVHATPVSVNTPDTNSEMHEVVVQEVLLATRYTYMNVSEAGNVYWMAVPKQEVEVGATYFYRGGFKKANFKSTEFDRMFETLLLVSQISKAPANTGGSALERARANIGAKAGLDQDTKIMRSEDGVTLKDLFENRDKYAGKTIKVKGKCVKINKNIMGTNWVHLQDGSDPEHNYDLTVTTMVDVPVGTVVEMEGRITLNKDFGAGYKYDVIMEDGHVY